MALYTHRVAGTIEITTSSSFCKHGYSDKYQKRYVVETSLLQ